MRVKALVWLGIPVDDCAGAGAFFARTLGLEVAFDEPDTVELAAANDDRIQLFGPGHRYFELFRSHGAAVVPLFEVEDLDQARAELMRSGAEIVAGPESNAVWTWLTFRGPGGNIYSRGARH
jgi:predicted enzyme related to lactoylglutathione lyase